MEDGDNVVGGPWPRKRLSEAELIARQKEIDYWWERHLAEEAEKRRDDPTGEEDLMEWIWGPGYRRRRAKR